MTAAEEPSSGNAGVLLAGLSAEPTAALRERIPGARLHAVDSFDALASELEKGAWQLLVLGLEPDGGVDAVRRLRSLAAGRDLPIVCCVHAHLPVDEARELVDSLGVARILFHPLDTDALAEQVRELVPGSSPPPPAEGVGTGLTALWERFRGLTMERVGTLEAAAAALSAGALELELRQRAENDAHKLAGGLGTFGYIQCSRVAQAAEMLLQGDLPLGAADAARLGGWTKEIREHLEDAPRPSPTPPPAAASPSLPPTIHPVLLVASADAEFADRVEAEAKARGLQVERMPDVGDGREAPDVQAAIVDLAAGEAALELLGTLAQRDPSPAVVALSGSDGFEERVEVARRGGRSFFRKPLPPGVLVDRVAQLLARGEVAGSKVLVLERDRGALKAMEALLATRNINLVAAADPERFWSRMESARPDLVVLDQDVADVRGEDLCRALRLDPRWQDLPVLFLATTLDAATVQGIFAAGASDFVRKPFVGPELLARLVSHLERARLLQSLRERTGPIGLPGRPRLMEEVTRLLQIAGRQGESVVLGRIDLDQLARVNDGVGPYAADEVLRQVALLLQSSLRAGDLVGWWSGDEFVVVLYGSERELAVERLNQVREAARARPIELNGQALMVTFSAGVAQFPMDGQDFGQLSGAAEGALRVAKESGGDRVVLAGAAAEASQSEVVDVVLVDDDDALAELLMHALDAEGLRARRVRDRERALELFAGSDPQLCPRVVLLGVDPSQPDGLRLLRELTSRGVGSRSHVVALTAHGADQAALDALEEGATDYVAKPFSVPVLLQRVWSVLQRA